MVIYMNRCCFLNAIYKLYQEYYVRIPRQSGRITISLYNTRVIVDIVRINRIFNTVFERQFERMLKICNLHSIVMSLFLGPYACFVFFF